MQGRVTLILLQLQHIELCRGREERRRGEIERRTQMLVMRKEVAVSMLLSIYYV